MELIAAIRDREPVLPRRLNSSLPRALQNICLKALEKNPVDRYSSAREMAEDIERYFAGQEVLGVPTSYSRLIAGRIDVHLRELEGWKNDQVVSDSEYDALKKGVRSPHRARGRLDHGDAPAVLLAGQPLPWCVAAGRRSRPRVPVPGPGTRRPPGSSGGHSCRRSHRLPRHP